MKSVVVKYGFPVFWLSLFIVLSICLSEARLPLVGAFLLAYLLHPIVDRITKWGVPEPLSIVLVFAVSLLSLIGLLSVVIPQFFHLILSLIQDLPDLVIKALETLERLAAAVDIPFHVEKDQIIGEVRHYLQSISFSTLTSMTGLLQKTVFNLIEVLFWVIKLLFFPVFFYYALHYYRATKEEIKSFFPTRYHVDLVEFSQIASRVLSGYIRGQLVVCSIMATYYATMFWLIDVKYGLVIGMLSGFAYMVPYVGIASAFLFGVGMNLANFVSPTHLAMMLGIYALGQSAEVFFLTPKITGNRVGLEPFITILVLIIGANMFGFLGVLLAIPVSGICREYYIRLKAIYSRSDFFTQG